MAVEGPQVLGDYLLIEQIGEGGMAEVYRAQYSGASQSVGPQNVVVVKRIKPALFKQPEFPIFREMFLNEAKLVRSLQHPNLARMHSLHEAVDKDLGMKVPFIVGEYIRGNQLWALMRIATHSFTGCGVPPAISAFVVREMARGLGHAHAHKDANTGRPQPIIHRDISPENIMVSDEGQIKVIDFGVAKAIGGFGPQTQTGIIKGKLAYMAPEQVSQKVVPATDVFGAGIVLHELLTGRRLFAANNDFLIVQKVLKSEIPRPSASTRGIPKELEDVLMIALSRDLSVRYPNGNAFAEALTEVMKQVPILRGTTNNSVKRWADKTLAEAAKIASSWEGSSSDDNLKPSDALGANDGPEEIELSGEDVMLSGLGGELDPAVRAAVSEGLRSLKPESLQRRSQPHPIAVTPAAASTVSGRRTPPPPPPSAISNPRVVSSPSTRPVDLNAQTPDLAASTSQQLSPVAANIATPANGAAPLKRPRQPGLPETLHSLLSDPQLVRWLGAVSALAVMVLLLLFMLLIRC